MTKSIFDFPCDESGNQLPLPPLSEVLLQYTDTSVERCTGICSFVEWGTGSDDAVYFVEQHCNFRQYPIEEALFDVGELEASHIYHRETPKGDFNLPSNKLRIWWAHNLAVVYANEYHGVAGNDNEQE